MEKLIELLNEYGNEKYNHWGDYQTDMDFTDRETYWYLSKKFGFIKWLVENEKVEFAPKPKEYRLQVELENGSYGELGGEARLLMLLSIQDEPIKFLISILKNVEKSD